MSNDLHVTEILVTKRYSSLYFRYFYISENFILYICDQVKINENEITISFIRY